LFIINNLRRKLCLICTHNTLILDITVNVNKFRDCKLHAKALQQSSTVAHMPRSRFQLEVGLGEGIILC